MNVIRLEKREYPARPQHDVREQTVLDSNGRYLGYVANLYVDEEDRQLRFVDVVKEGFLGLGGKHHLLPIEALSAAEEARRLGLYGTIQLQVDRETVERSPTFPNPLAGPDPDLQEAMRKHYGYD
jgi:PRC-barrel domain